jgi:hypothetical protein
LQAEIVAMSPKKAMEENLFMVDDFFLNLAKNFD